MSERKPRGFWHVVENVVSEARTAMKDNGWEVLPPTLELRANGYSSLAFAIVKHHKGFCAFRKEHLGEQNPRKKRDTWQDRQFVINYARKILQKMQRDELPAGPELRENGYAMFAAAVSKYHGGFHSLRKELGEPSLRAKRGSLHDINYCLDLAQKLMSENGLDSLPGGRALAKLGYSSLSNAILTYHGGYHEFREKLGQEQKRTRTGLWQDLAYTLDAAVKILADEKLDALPNAAYLQAHGYTGISNAIAKYHGGFPHFRELLSQSQGRPSEKEQLESLLKRYADE